jgi:hypothetical protein
MSAANWLTLLASVVALVSVIGSYFLGRRQIQSTAALAMKQIEAAANDTARKLRAEILLKEQQTWIRDFRETINELVYMGDPDLDGQPPRLDERLRTLVRLAHKVDLLLPIGETHASLISDIVTYAQFLRDGAHPDALRERLEVAGRIVAKSRRLLRDQLEELAAKV